MQQARRPLAAHGLSAPLGRRSCAGGESAREGSSARGPRAVSRVLPGQRALLFARLQGRGRGVRAVVEEGAAVALESRGGSLWRGAAARGEGIRGCSSSGAGG